jgi:alanine-glyoxylate transaminase/serine-glyoxylate transaminase/serine-pyruvate transaminase
MTALPFPRVLMGPGPCSIPDRVIAAMGRAPLGHLDPELFVALDEIQERLRGVFGTRNPFTIALTGTGMAGMESCFANLIEPGDTAVIGVHGFFGERMVEIAGRYGAQVIRVDAEWGNALDPAKMADAAAGAERVKLIACVHAETSVGVRQPLEPIAEVANRHDALFVVDAVTSLGGLPVEVDSIGIDACYSATQKCMGCPPGLAPLTVSERAFEAARNRRVKVGNWYLDWNLLANYWGGERAYHHTVPSNLLLGFREALRVIDEEGLESRYGRHQQASDRLISGLAELGIRPFPAKEVRLPTLNAVRIPEGIDDLAVRKRLLIEYGIEIGGGLGALKGKVWRIGTMGESATLRNVTLLLGALKQVLSVDC